MSLRSDSIRGLVLLARAITRARSWSYVCTCVRGFMIEISQPLVYAVFSISIRMPGGSCYTRGENNIVYSHDRGSVLLYSE